MAQLILAGASKRFLPATQTTILSKLTTRSPWLILELINKTSTICWTLKIMKYLFIWKTSLGLPALCLTSTRLNLTKVSNYVTTLTFLNEKSVNRKVIYRNSIKISMQNWHRKMVKPIDLFQLRASKYGRTLHIFHLTYFYSSQVEVTLSSFGSYQVLHALDRTPLAQERNVVRAHKTQAMSVNRMVLPRVQKPCPRHRI